MKNKKLLSVVLSGSMLLSSLSASMTVFASEGNVFTNTLEKASKVEFKGQKFTAKPLVILMDFQDYKHEDLEDKETDFRINSFTGEETTKEFYQDLFFGKDFYTTSDGKEHITVRKFFEEESGGVYDFDGTVVGWYTAKGNAVDYGKGGEDQTLCRDGLVKEAIEFAAKELDLSQFDVEDKWDLDCDGNYNEPDGIVDSIVVIHPGIGQEWGGGSLGDDAIWPFRWGYNIFGEAKMEEKNSQQKQAVLSKNPSFTDKNGKSFFIEDFTVFEQDLPLDLFCHEFGHVLGLPDLYDVRSSADVPVRNWSIMGGSYTGNPRGSQPNSYGAYCNEFLQKDFEKRGRVDAAWQKAIELNLNDITSEGQDIVLDQTSVKGSNYNTVRINLPDYFTDLVAQPKYGSKFFFSGCADYLENYMTTKNPIDLTNATAPKLSINAWYDLDPGFDFASVQVRVDGTEEWVCIKDTNGLQWNTVDQWVLDNESQEEIHHRNPGWGFTDKVDTWTDISFDLSAYKGKKIDLRFRLATDSNGPYSGFYFDNLKVADGESILFQDDAEGQAKFDFKGFMMSDGTEPQTHRYLLEWRNKDNGLVDQGLGTINIGRPGLQYDGGLVVWHINDRYEGFTPDQDVKTHPGELCAGIVDADQNPVMYKYVDGRSGADRMDYQIHDAAFSLRPGSKINISSGEGANAYTIEDNNTFMNPYFNDNNDYSANYFGKGVKGLTLQQYGLNVFVTEESSDRSSAKIHIAKATENAPATVQGQTEIKNVDLEDGKLVVKTDKQYSDTAYALLVNGTEKQELTLKYENGAYVAAAKTGADWKVSHIILSDVQGNAKAIYNSAANGLYGINMDNMSTVVFQPVITDKAVETTLAFESASTTEIAKVLVGAYDANGKLIASSVKNVEVKPGETIKVENIITIPTEATTIKVFLWESKPNFGPLKRAFVKNLK